MSAEVCLEATHAHQDTDVFRESVVNRNSSSNTTCEMASGVLNIEHIHTQSWDSTTSAAFCKSCIFSDAKTFIFCCY